MQETNLRISPYFDDFDSSKNYQKVLFKPGYSVQTRELNTLQSILQNQVEKFGQHIFKDGSLVIPGNVNYDMSARAVLIQPLINGITVESYLEALKGKILTGAFSGVKAEVTGTLSASMSEKDTTTLYVAYNYGGIEENNEQIKEFKNNEILLDDEGTALAITTVQNSTSYTGSTVNINSGVYFIRGFFVEVLPQKIILEQYNTRPTYKVGLQISENVVSSEEDDTLYDNSLGSTNFASPGADRLKFNLELVKQNLLITENSNFIELMRFEDGIITQQADAYQSAYSQLEKNLARRTYSNHGSFTTQPYNIKIREALNDGVNGGVYFANEISYDGRTIVDEIPQGASLSNVSANEYTDGTTQYIIGKDYYAIELSEGKAYVEGFEVLNERKQYTLVRKPRKTQSINNQGTVLQIGSYVKIAQNSNNLPEISGTVKLGDNLILKDIDNTAIGVAKSVGLVNSERLYINSLSIFEDLTVSSLTGISEGDFITGNTSGATGFINLITTSTLLLQLTQVTGTFISGESISSSNADLAAGVSITNVKKYLLENVRKFEKIGSVSFSCIVKLDSLPITGSSFTVTGGNKLNGINTSFNFELSEKSKIQIGGEAAIEVDSINSDGTEVTLSSSVANGTYYSVRKQICKLYSSETGFTSKISLNPVKSVGENFPYVNNNLIVETKTAGAGGQFEIQSATGTAIDTSSITITAGSTSVSFDASLSSSNIAIITNTGLSAGASATIYYSVRFPNPTVRKKTKESYKFLSVKLAKSSANDKYGTRFTDKEISLKYADVIKVHAIHQALNDSDDKEKLFDSVVLNDSSQINEGDILTLGTVRARVISKVSANKVYIKYLSTSRFQTGKNLAISINIIATDKIDGIFIKESYYGKYEDVTDDFKFVRNDTDDFYRISKLVRKSSAAEPTQKIVVVFDYFKHENLENDFYSVESYGDLEYSDIPLSYKYASMADIIDFRYYTESSIEGATSGSISSPFIETVSAFNIYTSPTPSNQKVPTPGSIFGLDYNFYTGRVDKVYLTSSNQKYGYITGELRVVQGGDSIEPALAEDDSVGLLLATINLPPYLKNVGDAKITFEKTRNYTMRDIGKLEDRLTNVEKYTSLTLLEVNTNNLNILDDEGRNRFKNGFVVDGFNSTDVADISNPDFSASLDLTKNIVRPYPAVNNTGFYFDDSSSSAKLNRTYVTIPYEETPLVSQVYSSRVENLFPYEVFSWVGNMDLFPKKDIWYDTQREIVEGQNINLVDSYTALFDLTVPGGQVWGNWNLGSGGSTRGGGGTTIVDIMPGTQYDVGSLNFDIESGDTIQDVIDIKYSRSRIVNINATLLKPNTRFYFYIDDTESADIIYPNVLSNLTNQSGQFILGEKVDLIPVYNDDIIRAAVVNNLSATVVDPNLFRDSSDINSSDFNSDGYQTQSSILAIDDIRSQDNSDINPTILGTTFMIIGRNSGAFARSENQQSLYSDRFGNLNAFVLIPPTTFETGDLTFSISDIPGNLQVKGITGSYAIGQYYSQGTELNVTANITTLEAPELTATAITRERRRFIPDPPPAPAGHDPIAQSFFIGEEGVFITSIELFFLSKDDIQPVTIDIRTMENGTPTSFILPGSIVTVQSKDVKTSTDASESTTFVFDNPIFLSSNNSYSFIIRTTNKNYNMWVSRLGETDVTTGLFIDKQPYVGVLYKSSNQSIWTPDQYEDVKFIMNRAQFNTNTTYTAVLPNIPIIDQKLNKNPLKFVGDSSIVTVFQPNHGMHDAGNKVKISGVNSDLPNASLSTGISGNDSTIPIADVLGTIGYDASNDGWNTINNQSISSINPGFAKIGDEIITYTGIAASQLTGCLRGKLGTQAVTHSAGTSVQPYQINGIISSQLNTTHTISNIISLDEYQIIVPNIANRTKQSGGSFVTATRNIQYETITPNFNVMSPTATTTDFSITSVSGTSIGNSSQQSFDLRPLQSINNKVENLLDEPKLILSDPNKSTYQTGSSGTLTTYVNMSTTSDRVSPVLDIAGSSIVTITNRLNKEVDVDGDLNINSELTPSGGKHSSYITKKVVLETSASSVKVLFDGIRTEHNDIKIFVKIKGDSTPGEFNDMNYIEIPTVSYPVSKNKKDFKAFDYEIKSLREFQEFSIKLVMIGNDQSDVPIVRNFRALALAL
tara:strand:+ start:22260 stop:28709 length:6450 start_codon:yes stop_codon:yes gene_type:complete